MSILGLSRLTAACRTKLLLLRAHTCKIFPFALPQLVTRINSVGKHSYDALSLFSLSCLLLLSNDMNLVFFITIYLHHICARCEWNVQMKNNSRANISPRLLPLRQISYITSHHICYITSHQLHHITLYDIITLHLLTTPLTFPSTFTHQVLSAKRSIRGSVSGCLPRVFLKSPHPPLLLAQQERVRGVSRWAPILECQPCFCECWTVNRCAKRCGGGVFCSRGATSRLLVSADGGSIVVNVVSWGRSDAMWSSDVMRCVVS
jgi:hypothetical protein